MIRKASTIALSLIATAITLFGNVRADDVSLHGFLEGNYSAGLAARNPDGGDFKLAEERLQLKLDASKDPFHVFIKADTFYDHVDEKWNSELREGYLDLISSKWDARLGRQVITWGLGDMVFINDMFPKDYEAFFSGRPLEYMKKGIDGVKFGIYPGFASFELVAIPFFTHDTYPSANRFSMFDPMPDITDREKAKTAVTLDNTEFAARAYRDIAGFDTSVYFYKGFFRQPSMMPDNPVNPTKLTLFYPKLSVYGTSVQGRALDGVLSLEAGYYDSREDRAGSNPIIPNSETRYLIGYQRQMWEDFTMGVQYYGEYMHDYSQYVQSLPSGFPRQRKLHELTTVRLTQLLVNQTLKLSFFAFYSPSDGDYMLNPEIKYNFTDSLWSALGANIFFGGNRSCQFGQFAKDDNVYVQVRYEF
ncbi:MAG: hypothetical protein HQK89_09025 [Nitrospirae bacterium]|nr:hypothetical protein [Nitrospirota bacterium]